MPDMKDNLPNIDQKKIELLIDIKTKYNKGELSFEQAKSLLKEHIKELRPYEIAYAEQCIKQFDKDECIKEDIQEILMLYEDILIKENNDLPINHPINLYYRENEIIKELCENMKKLLKQDFSKDKWLEVYKRLIEYKTHFIRKQNQLYSALEKKGFDRPTTTMWVLDDYIFDEIKKSNRLLNADKIDLFLSEQETVIYDILDLIGKEETILYPSSLILLNENDFKYMEEGDDEIGYAFIKKTPTKADDGLIDLNVGKLTVDQINQIFSNLPVDVSFTDENDTVCFYSDSKDRIFPRSKNVIGRTVQNCHPPKSIAMVQEIIDKFKSGEEDRVDFWIDRDGKFIFITYIAIRDKNGKYKGILEMMQDASKIRALSGSRLKLVWGDDTEGEVETDEIEDDTDNDEITPSTRVKILIDKYPNLINRLPEINPKFKMLQSTFGKMMLRKARVQDMSDRTGIEINEMISKLKKLISEL